MAKQSTASAHSRDPRTSPLKRPRSYVLLEGLLLLGAFGILCILIGFFTLELHSLSAKNVLQSADSSSSPSTPLSPPRVESQVLGSQLALVEVDATGTILRTLYSSDLSDGIADFTLFSVPQTAYQGLIYVRPILDGNLPYLKIYPLDVQTGTLKAATLNVPADTYILSSDQTVVGVQSDHTLTLYALEDGAVLAQGTIPQDWIGLALSQQTTLALSENLCLSLTSTLAPQNITPFLAVCP